MFPSISRLFLRWKMGQKSIDKLDRSHEGNFPLPISTIIQQNFIESLPYAGVPPLKQACLHFLEACPTSFLLLHLW